MNVSLDAWQSYDARTARPVAPESRWYGLILIAVLLMALFIRRRKSL
jgi:hypothetical protein